VQAKALAKLFSKPSSMALFPFHYWHRIKDREGGGKMYQIDKLIDFTERRAEQIAREWCQNIKKNPRTPSYHKLADEHLIPQAVRFYRNLGQLVTTESALSAIDEFADQYVSERITDGVPMHEAVYALIMMRRHIWLFAEFQLLFTTAQDMYQAVEGINKIVLLTDYAIYSITEKYSRATPGKHYVHA
jgi:hypothetical protein